MVDRSQGYLKTREDACTRCLSFPMPIPSPNMECPTSSVARPTTLRGRVIKEWWLSV